jgi:hypothetical protein
VCVGGFGEEALVGGGLGALTCGECAADVGRAAGPEVCATSRGEVSDEDEHAASTTTSTTPSSEGVRRIRGRLLSVHDSQRHRHTRAEFSSRSPIERPSADPSADLPHREDDQPSGKS